MSDSYTELRCHITYQDTVLNEVGDSIRASVKPGNDGQSHTQCWVVDYYLVGPLPLRNVIWA